MMEQLISEFPNHISDALSIAANTNLTKPNKDFDNILICGMGGSGIGGVMVAKWVEAEVKVPVLAVHDYVAPEFVSERTLIIGSSYSGNTEETLDCIEQALEKGAHLVGITSGGKLEALCKEKGYESIIVPGGNPPRSMLAFSVVQLVNVLKQYGFIAGKELEEFEAARKLIVDNEAEIKEKAMDLAKFLKGNVGIFYGTTKYGPVLVRARQQINENSKNLCWHHVIPEMNHNELVGWGGGDDRFATVFFLADDIHPRNAKRIEINKEVITKKTSKMMDIVGKGETTLIKSFYFINIVDWASLYLSKLNEVDAIDIAVIDHLKGELAKF